MTGVHRERRDAVWVITIRTHCTHQHNRVCVTCQDCYRALTDHNNKVVCKICGHAEPFETALRARVQIGTTP